MSRFTISTPGIVSLFAGGAMLDIFAVSTPGTKHLLHTTSYLPGGREFTELVPQKSVSWDVEVPAGAQLFSVTGGVLSGRPQQFWVGWLVDRSLHMQALMQEAPINTTLVTGEVPIFPAILDSAGHAALYSWRPTPTGAALWRRMFSGAIHKPGIVTAAQVSELPGARADRMARGQLRRSQDRRRDCSTRRCACVALRPDPAYDGTRASASWRLGRRVRSHRGRRHPREPPRIRWV
jgi:hypothetical protein